MRVNKNRLSGDLHHDVTVRFGRPRPLGERSAQRRCHGGAACVEVEARPVECSAGVVATPPRFAHAETHHVDDGIGERLLAA
jgi:hypothetical protein